MDDTTKATTTTTKKPRGFAAMDPKKREEIARKGGRAVAEKGNGHRWTKEEASAAGRRGVAAREAARAAEGDDTNATARVVVVQAEGDARTIGAAVALGAKLAGGVR